MFRNDIYSLKHAYRILESWLNRMHPPYDELRWYEGVSKYISKFDVIVVQSNWKKNINDVSMKIRPEIAALIERDYIVLGKKYDMDNILEYIDMFDQAQCFDEYFHRK